MSTRASLNLMYDNNRRIQEHRRAETQRIIHETNLRRWDQQFQTLREHQQAAIHYKPYSPSTPLIQPTMGGSLSVNGARPWLVLASTATSGIGAFLIAACITTDFCAMAASGGSVGGCVCLACTAYHINEYYRTKPFVPKTQNQQQQPQETNSWSWCSFENCGV